MSETLGQRVVTALRTAAQAYASGDQVAPCAVLWADPERMWECVVTPLRSITPELFILGNYAPEQRTGPALWLRCLEARSLDVAPATGIVPIFYLPGISREQLRAVEDCPPDLAALVELQFRGTLWLHVNGKEWTPYAFLVSKHGGLGFDVARDQATLDALAGALPALVDEPLAHLHGRLLNAEFFNELIAPDANGLVLRWLNDATAFQQRRSAAEWNAFRQQCKADFRFDPEKDGPLKAAQMLADRGNHWNEAWQRFAESPTNYPGIVDWLKRAAPKSPTMFDSAEVWPHLNERDERQLQSAAMALEDRPSDEVTRRIAELEMQHGARRRYPWQKLGLSPLATALEPLAQLAKLCQISPGAPTPEAFGEFYASEGWRVDAAALATLAACETNEQHTSVLAAVRAVYLPWLETTSRHLQQLIRDHGPSVLRRSGPIEPAPGRVVLFADGLRLDVGQQLAQHLTAVGLDATPDWEWSAIPTVTATAKPAASPLAGNLKGGEASDEFAPNLVSSGQRLTQDRFVFVLQERGWQCLGPEEIGDPAGSAWTEGGALDKRGHNEGWKLARAVATELRDLTSRIASLLQAGWSEVMVVTDHGWLLVPGGLPKVELKSFLAEHRWGRCAALKATAQTAVPTFPWHWNPDVTIATPPGVGCFRASMEYSHGGVSLQEMVIPRLRVIATRPRSAAAHLVEVKWTSAKCRVTVGGDCSGARVDVRVRRSEPASSLLADHQARETTPEGKVTVFLENDADTGRSAEIVLLDAAGQVIDSLPTKLGE